MFQLGDFLRSNLNFMRQTPSLEEKLDDGKLPLEDYLKDDEAISCVKLMGKNTKKYFNSEKIKELIKLITEEPKEDDQLRGHKFPYIASEILKSDCPFISKRFILNEQEYDEEYGEINEEDKEIDFDFCKNEFDSDYSKIEEKLKKLKKNREEIKKEMNINLNNEDEDNNKKENENKEEDNNDELEGDLNIENNEKEQNQNIDENKENEEENDNENNNKNLNIINQNNNGENIDIEENNEKNENIMENIETNIKIEEKEDKINEKNNEEKDNENNNINNNEENQLKEEQKEGIKTNEINIEDNKDKEEIKVKGEEGNKEENEIIEEKKNIEIKEINEENNKIENKGDNLNEEKIEEQDKEEEKQEENKEKEEEKKEEHEKKEIKKGEENLEKKEDKEKDEEKREENKEKEIEKKEENIEKKEENKEKKEEVEKEENGVKKEENENDQKEMEKEKERIEKEMEKEKERIKKEIEKEKERIEKEMEKEKERIEKEMEKEDEKSEKIKEGKNEKNNEEGKNENKEEKIENEEENKEKEETDIKNDEKIEVQKDEQNEEMKEENQNKNEELIINQNDIEKEENKKENINQEQEKGIKEEKELEENNQEEEVNEEIDNIIIDNEVFEGLEEKEDEEEKKEKTNDNNINENEENIIKKDEDSLSIEGEIEDLYSTKKAKPKKKYENKPNNEYLDLLLNFVMNDKPELNYVLSGYFANVMITLINNYPSQILKYLYTQRKDAIKKIIFHSNQKAFAILSLKLLNLESYISSYKQVDNNAKETISSNIYFRNELIGEIIKSISLEGFISEKGEIKTDVDIEGKFALILDIINENKNVVEYLVLNNEVYTHIFNILNTELYNEDNNNNNFNNKYFIYGLFINLITKLIQNAQSKLILNCPNELVINFINKEKNELTFSENIILSLGKIVKNNFLAKKPKLIMGENSTIPYEGLGILNIKIITLIQEIFSFMKEIPSQLDNILIRNGFCQKSINYFFEYQWNNIYHNKFVELFNLYLSKEESHSVLTEYIFNNLKFHELLINYLNQGKDDQKTKLIPNQKLKFIFKSGKSINSGIYPHVIDLIYKIQSIGGLVNFTEEEKNKLKIKNYGEFEFSKDETSNKLIKKLNISDNINTKLKDLKEWNDTVNETVIPLVKKYEGQLCKEEENKDDNSDEGDGLGYDPLSKVKRASTNLLLEKLLNVIKKDKNPSKRFSLPLSRNEKNKNIIKNDKGSIRDKLLNKGRYNSHKIFDDDEDEKNKDNNNNTEENNENNLEENKIYNDTNYWEVKNELPEKLKKEVDRKTNIIFNYNPITGENDNKNEISEEDELLSIAMGVEQNEKIEKSKKIKYIIPGKLKPINLKTRTNPVQTLFTVNPSNKDSQNNFTQMKLMDIMKRFNEDSEKSDDQEKETKVNSIENEENEEEEEGVVKKEEKEENIIDKEKEEKEEKEKNNDINLEEKKENENNKEYNDVNYWGINSGNYLTEKEMESCLNDL